MTSYPRSPSELLVNGNTAPLGIAGPHPWFSWRPESQAIAARVRVIDSSGARLWDSGIRLSDQPRMRYAGQPLSSRQRYAWQVQTSDLAGSTSPWSDFASFETGLLHPDDWKASWISRQVPAGHRIIRSIESDRVDWADEHTVLAQSFFASGPFTALNINLASERGAAITCAIELCNADGSTVLARRDVEPERFPGDRFEHFLDAGATVPAGEYLVRIVVTQGTVGWLTSSTPAELGADDGVSALPVRGEASVNGVVVDGVRALGVETVPAPDPYFTRTFTVSGPAHSARLYAVGLGYGRFEVNGVPVTEIVLEPSPTDTGHTVLYRAFDVTTLLIEGENTLTAFLGRGFYSTRGASIWAWNLAPWNHEPTVIAQLEWQSEDGMNRIGTDSSWLTAAGPIVSDVLYTGEIYDARWPGVSGTEPDNAITVAGPIGALTAAEEPPILTHDPLTPVSATPTATGSTVYDFGQIIAGWAELDMLGGPGDTVSVAYGEQLDADGHVICDNILAIGAAQIDKYRFADTGFGTVHWAPLFSYKGFQFAEVTVSAGASVTAISAVPVHTSVRTVGAFDTGEETLKWLDDAVARTIVNNLHGIPTDTPVYEKNGWTADAHLAAEAALHHFDLFTFLTKWLRDHADSQAPDGTVPQIVPSPGWGRGLDPAWSASYPLIAWNVYWEYGDIAVLEEHVDGILRYVASLHDVAEPAGWIWPLHSWGDWLSPGHQFPPEGPAPTATLMMYRATQKAADICAALGRDDDRDRLVTVMAHIADAYNSRYFDAESGTYRSEGGLYRQAMNVLPLAFGVAPDADAEAVAAGLAADVRDVCDSHLNVGAAGVKHLLPILTQYGYHDLALTVVTQPTRPGWGLWKAAGSATLWESWDEDVRSWDHYFLGSVAQWIHEDVAGLRPTAAGWSRFAVAPHTDSRVPWTSIAHTTPRGEAKVEWNRTDDYFSAIVEVPLNTVADISVPVTGAGTLTVDGSLKSNWRPDDTIELQPGSHRIEWTRDDNTR